MEKSVDKKAPAKSPGDYEFGNAVLAMLVGAFYLGMCFDPKVNFTALMPVVIGISLCLPGSGHANTIPLRIGGAVMTFLSCFLGAALSELRLAAKNSGVGLLHYCSSDSIAAAFGAAFHDAPYLWYLCAAALGFVGTANSPFFKTKIPPVDKTDQNQGEKTTI